MKTMKEQLSALVAIPSVSGPADGEFPFGRKCGEALALGLKMAEDMGFKTVNMENYCGYIEMGEGKDLIGIAAHLDVVPADEGWDSDPFTMVEKDGVLYGRGVSDDKGAFVATLAAMARIKASGKKLTKRVRLLAGCSEETGSACMKYYTAHEGPVTAGFTPDGGFPGIFGEKAGGAMKAMSKKTAILSMTGGTVKNAVCRKCVTTLPASAVDAKKLEEELKKTALVSSTVTVEDGIITVEAIGVSCHASAPAGGVNAIGCTMAALEKAGMKDDFVTYYNTHVDIDGTGYGINVSDKYGALTMCNGVVETVDGRIVCHLDIRVPVTFNGDDIRKLAAARLEDEKGVTEIVKIGKSLFFPPESSLVTKLHEAYIEVTGDTVTQPRVIGGGTYAKEVPGIIAFGCSFPGSPTHIHEANECLRVDELEKQSVIYEKAILKLLED